MTNVTTWEEANQCPVCKQPGSPGPVRPAPSQFPHGTKVHEMICKNQVCPTVDVPWFIQVNPDGSIPPPQDHSKPNLHIPNVTDAQMERLRENIREQQRIETDPSRHGEIRGR